MILLKSSRFHAIFLFNLMSVLIDFKLPTNKTYPVLNGTTICKSTATCGTGGFFPFGVSGM
jgi:hypothetical protein